MPKVNLLALPRPQPAETITKVYTDPNQPGVELTLTLRSLSNDLYAQTLALERAAAFEEEYRENWFPHPSGEAIRITERVAQNLALLEAMQAGPAEERYSAEELLGLLLSMPVAFTEVMVDVAALSRLPALNGHDPNP